MSQLVTNIQYEWPPGENPVKYKEWFFYNPRSKRWKVPFTSFHIYSSAHTLEEGTGMQKTVCSCWLSIIRFEGKYGGGYLQLFLGWGQWPSRSLFRRQPSGYCMCLSGWESHEDLENLPGLSGNKGQYNSAPSGLTSPASTLQEMLGRFPLGLSDCTWARPGWWRCLREAVPTALCVNRKREEFVGATIKVGLPAIQKIWIVLYQTVPLRKNCPTWSSKVRWTLTQVKKLFRVIWAWNLTPVDI